MRIVNVSIDLVIDDTIDILNSAPSGSNNYYYDGSYYDKTKIADYLNDKIYNDPEFFGDFGPENIVTVKEIE
jgi:hypothetical protein